MDKTTLPNYKIDFELNLNQNQIVKIILGVEKINLTCIKAH